MTAQQFSSFSEFWPHYLREHHRPGTRRLHVFGTTLALVILCAALATRQWWALLAVPLFGYGLAWFSHLLIERNRPASFRHPWWSLRGDLRMWRLVVTGRMRPELNRVLGNR